MSTVIYAIGGGLGHFTRSLALVHTLGDQLSSPCVILVSPGVEEIAQSCLGRDLLLRELPWDGVANPSRTKAWVEEQILEWKPDILVVDCFPLGIFEELEAVLGSFAGRCLHVARALKAMSGKADGLRCPFFDVIYTVESCPRVQMERLRMLGGRVESLRLRYPDRFTNPPPEELSQACLVVHSGGEREIRALMEFAGETFPELPRIVVSTRGCPTGLPENARWLPLYPAWPWFGRAAALVSACGFNTMEQMRGVATPHAYLPMPRRFDDQHRRARARRAKSK